MLFLGFGFLNVHSQTVVTIGSETSTTYDYQIPINNLWGYSYTQQIVLSTEIGMTGTITKLRFKHNTGSMVSNDNWSVYLGYKAGSTFSSTTDWLGAGSLTNVFNGTVTASGGWIDVTFSTEFFYDNSLGNLVVAVNEKSSSYTYVSNMFPINAGSNRSLYIRKDASPAYDISSPGSGTRYNNFNTMRLEITPPSAGACDEVAWSVGTVTAPTSICPGLGFTVSESGASYVTGLERQWQQSTDAGGTWADIVGATSTSYNVAAGITATTMYRLTVSCPDEASTLTSTAVTVAVTPFTSCYCTPVYSSGCGIGARVNDVTTTGGSINISNLGTACGSGSSTGYIDYSASHTLEIVQGVSGSTTIGVSNYSGGVKVWIDYNQNGIFETGEIISASSATIASGSSHTQTFTVPLTSVAGETRMRVRVVEGSTVFDACSSASYGEAEDYKVNIISAVGCETITFAKGTLSAPAPCPSTSFTVTNTGSMTATGVTRVWQSRNPSGTGTWTTIAGATGTNLPVTAGIASATDYRCIVTCTASSVTDTTNELTVNLAPFTECYCTPVYTYGCSGGARVNNVTTTGGSINISNLSTECASGATGYTDYSATHTLEITQGLAGSTTIGVSNYSGGVKVWIDYNQNGLFETSEMISESASTIGSGASHTQAFTVPLAAVPGATKMRVRVVESSTTFDACGTASWGEAEDYGVTIVAAIGCESVAFEEGTISAPATICPNVLFTVTNTGSMLASGVSRVWQSSPAGAGTWTTISGATTTNLTVTDGIVAGTDFRCIVTCTASSTTDTTNVVTVNMGAATDCYCEPVTGTSSTNNYIVNVTLTSDEGTFSNATGYNVYTNYAPTLSVSAIQGTDISFTVNGYTGGSMSYCKIWIDWNQNGSFLDPGEEVYALVTGSGSLTFTGTITVPFTAPSGNTRMRIFTDWYSAVSSGYAAIEPCASTAWGEAEDYGITVISSCSPMATVTAGVGGPACAGGDISLIATTDLTGSTFSWTGPGGYTSTDQNPTITGATVAMSGVYMMTATEPTNGCMMSASVTVTVNPVPNAFTITPATSMICPGSSVALTASDGDSYSGVGYDFEAFPFTDFSTGGTGSLTVTQSTSIYAEGAAAVRLQYPNSANATFGMNANVDLSGLSTAVLSFSQIAGMEGIYGTDWDKGFVEYSSNGGTTWGLLKKNLHLIQRSIF